MKGYRLSPADDEMDDYDEAANINVDDDIGDYGDDEEEETIVITETVLDPGNGTGSHRSARRARARQEAR